MTWLPVGELDLQELGPYSARDEDEMIELIDVLRGDILYFHDRTGQVRGRVVPHHSYDPCDERTHPTRVT
jgi:hypothetical protein